MKKTLRKLFAVFAAAVMTVTAAAVPVSAEEIKLSDNEAIRFVDSLGAGWNLGNQFDAMDEPQYTKSDDMVYETLWSGAKTTKELIKAVKDAGFKTIRIPVSWHNHVDKNFNIKKPWLNRVKEVVDWSLDEGLYVIINMHHDIMSGYFYPSKSELANSKEYVTKIWTQLSDTFSSYDNRLIFESANEPRLRGTEYEWYYQTGNIPVNVADSLDCINQLNQTFVDTVRASGGKNKTRFLLMGGYATAESEIGTMSKYFKMPTDTVKDRLIADVHYYCSNMQFSTDFLDALYKRYVSAGIPVVMSEFGLRKDYEEGYYLYDKTKESADMLGRIVSAARECGISCIFWDNNYGGKGKLGFKIIDRATAKLDLPEIAKAIADGGKPTFPPGTIIDDSDTSDNSGTSDNSDTSDKSNASDTSTAKSKKPTVKASAYKTKIKLSWSKSDSVQKYGVYQLKNGKYVRVKTVTGTSATIKNLKAGKTYKFKIKALVNGKWTSYSDIVKVKTNGHL